MEKKPVFRDRVPSVDLRRLPVAGMRSAGTEGVRLARGRKGRDVRSLHRIIVMSVFRTAMCFAGFVFYMVFRQVFTAAPQHAAPVPPASHEQVPLSEEGDKLELMKKADQPA